MKPPQIVGSNDVAEMKKKDFINSSIILDVNNKERRNLIVQFNTFLTKL